VSFDERGLRELIVESEDLQSDALRGLPESIDNLRDLRNDRRGESVDPSRFLAFERSRRQVLRDLGISGLAIPGLGLAGGFGAAIASALTQTMPVAAADSGIDIMILQTASSLEKLAVLTYGAALTLPFIANGNPTVKAFATTTMSQHDQHRMAFQAQTTALGGKVQDMPNPKYAPIVEAAKPTLKAPADVVALAMTLENVARDTYLSDLKQFTDKKSLMLMSSVMGVETQHLATLRAVAALLAGNAPQLITIPVDPSKLPAAAGSVGFPDAIPTPKLASPPAEGAVQ
jgi:ferritin-like protein